MAMSTSIATSIDMSMDAVKGKMLRQRGPTTRSPCRNQAEIVTEMGWLQRLLNTVTNAGMGMAATVMEMVGMGTLTGMDTGMDTGTGMELRFFVTSR